MNPNAKGALLALVAFGVFASHDVVIKVLGATYSPIQIVFFSVILSFPLATLWLLRDQTHGTLIPRHPYWMLARTIAAVVTGFSAFYAFSVLPLAQVYAIIFASPLLITVLAIPILGEEVRLRRWIAVLVGLCGVLVVLRPGETELGLGHLAALTCAVGGAFASVIVRKIGREERTVVIMLYPMMANFLVMGALLPTVYVPMPIEDLGRIAIVAVFAWIGGRFLIAAYNTGEAVIVAPMQYSQILWATAYGAFFFNEYPDMGTLVGSSIIIASGLYIVLRESRSTTSETPVLRTRSRPETGTSPRIGPFLWPLHPKKKKPSPK
ncbi:drug/metabolite transporter (DMT)-like permease [Litoreibacter meonggei]|uniref:Drug/metabolite transporter (DMT)-like permease n=1 Tax=Litoreibacter meonggei TaxID=1049199 RepID=A0A497VMH6_9RHOB|nr:DMT family transporter [Litoreibacter meonggei]RLJ41405.1 drug/metabolite transporter (DMT)-like permease [Litoreibacter meonggei]